MIVGSFFLHSKEISLHNSLASKVKNTLVSLLSSKSTTKKRLNERGFATISDQLDMQKHQIRPKMI